MQHSIFKLFPVLLLSFSLNAYEFVLEPTPEINKLVDFKASELCELSKNTQKYIESVPEDKFAVHAGTVFDNIISMKDVERTLGFICSTYREDVRSNREPSQIFERSAPKVLLFLPLGIHQPRDLCQLLLNQHILRRDLRCLCQVLFRFIRQL